MERTNLREDMLQVVFVKWGVRYSLDWVQRHVQAIKRHATCDVRFVCITDEVDRETTCNSIRLVPFPDFTASREYLKQGTRLKLSVFRQGILEEGIPALVIDLDTSVVGDVSKFATLIAKHRGIHMMTGHYLPWWRIQNLLPRPFLSKYYHANGSAMGFMPEDYYWLFDRFNSLVTGQPMHELPKCMKVDDRFISWSCKESLRVFPLSLITKYSHEYMFPSLMLEDIRSKMPWVRKRREKLVAVSFPGLDMKPDELAKMPVGSAIRHKRVVGRWNQTTLRNYWLEPVKPSEAA
jgi:hypothetical protein